MSRHNDRTDWFNVRFKIHPKHKDEWGEWFTAGTMEERSIEGFLESRGFTKSKTGEWLFTSKVVRRITFNVTSNNDAQAYIDLCRKTPAVIERSYPAVEVKPCDRFGNVHMVKVNTKFPN